MRPRPSRLAWIPTVLLPALYSLWGLLFRDWSAGSLFFWFTCDFFLAGVTTFVLGRAWRGSGVELPRSIRELGSPAFLLTFAMVLLYALIFTGMALKGELGADHRLPDFLGDKIPGLVASLLAFSTALVVTLRKPERGLDEGEAAASGFVRRAGVVMGLYAVLMIHHHWSGARSLDASPGYRAAMGALLVLLKAAAELGAVNRLFGRR